LSNIEQAVAPTDFDQVQTTEETASPEHASTLQLGKRGLLLLSWLAPAAVVIVWELLARAGWITPQVLPAPSKVIATAIKLATTEGLLNDLGVSLLRAAAGFAIGGSVGFALGILVGFSRIAEAAIDRSVQMIRQVDPKLIELGRVQGLGSLELIRRIVLPGALPSILTGVRYALATAWLALVVAETIGAQSGIGFLAMDAREFLRTDVIVLTIVIYALIGVAADAIARLLERRLLAWHPIYGGGR
jgi:sulfonate transport system permease protein